MKDADCRGIAPADWNTGRAGWARACVGSKRQISSKIRQICVFRARLNAKRGSKGGPKEVPLGSHGCHGEVISGSDGVLGGSHLLCHSDARRKGRSCGANARGLRGSRVCRSDFSGPVSESETNIEPEPRGVTPPDQTGKQGNQLVSVHQNTPIPKGKSCANWRLFAPLAVL